MEIILASSSPRRRELLSRITQNFTVKISDFDESTIGFYGDFGEYVKELSYNKAMDVAKNISKEALIIGADTIVALDDQVLGKPIDEKAAIDMIKSLSGRTHEVYSGITVIKTPELTTLSDFAVTSIKFSDLSDEEILNYVKTKEPLDKAGAYGIQGLGGVFVEEIHGCYYNVVGLPLNKLKKLMDALILKWFLVHYISKIGMGNIKKENCNEI